MSKNAKSVALQKLQDCLAAGMRLSASQLEYGVSSLSAILLVVQAQEAGWTYISAMPDCPFPRETVFYVDLGCNNTAQLLGCVSNTATRSIRHKFPDQAAVIEFWNQVWKGVKKAAPEKKNAPTLKAAAEELSEKMSAAEWKLKITAFAPTVDAASPDLDARAMGDKLLDTLGNLDVLKKLLFHKSLPKRIAYDGSDMESASASATEDEDKDAVPELKFDFQKHQLNAFTNNPHAKTRIGAKEEKVGFVPKAEKGTVKKNVGSLKLSESDDFFASKGAAKAVPNLATPVPGSAVPEGYMTAEIIAKMKATAGKVDYANLTENDMQDVMSVVANLSPKTDGDAEMKDNSPDESDDKKKDSDAKKEEKDDKKKKGTGKKGAKKDQKADPQPLMDDGVEATTKSMKAAPKKKAAKKEEKEEEVEDKKPMKREAAPAKGKAAKKAKQL
ncbi:unnamed protein product [Amoebophrya sp. A120]|nr:unnamed protein product [Amoebophrya sp. A120]|eukprot:GSA120T00021121001.1